MKLKLIFTGFVFAIVSSFCAAQNSQQKKSPILAFKSMPDSIRIEFPEAGAILVFEFRRIENNFSLFSEFPSQFGGWLKKVASSIPDSSKPRKISISAGNPEETKITVADQTDVTHVRTSGDAVTELLPPGWEIVVNYPSARVYAYAQTFKDLETLSTKSLKPVFDKLSTAVPMHRKSYSSRFVIKGDSIAYEKTDRQVAGDLLELNLSGGLGILGDKVYPEVNPYATLVFFSRFHKQDYAFTFKFNTLFFTERGADGGFTTRPNSFVTAAWMKNLIRGKAEASWIGLGAGLLVRRSGDYFKGQTIKLFVTKDVGRVNLAPELYLTNDYKKAILGFRLNYTF